jgi:hypothetical protein
VPGRQALCQQRERDAVVDPLGYVHRCRRGYHGAFGVPATVEERHNPPPVVGPARDLGSGHVRQHRPGQVRALGDVGVAVVDAGRVDVHQQLVGPGLRVGNLGDRQHLWSAGLGHLNGTHR